MNYLPSTNPLILLINNDIYTNLYRRMSLPSRFSNLSKQSIFDRSNGSEILKDLIFGKFQSKV